ncbi:MAG: aminoacetone oxidase family FAD-binding enzyme [Clostridia bacterium]|nr:aminoacetone oxidase family FAD-binding enzyme [Clostridia bacterium]
MSYDVLIVGGGASGLAAAARLAGHPVRVLLLERNPRVGKKLLSTGNGRCNLSNEQMSASLYGHGAVFVRELYQVIPPEKVLAFFHSLGLMTLSEEGRIYPRTMTAASVLDTLRQAIDAPNITLVTDTEITALGRESDGTWVARSREGKRFHARYALLAAGGSAAPKSGSDGSGAALLAALSLPLTPASPALVQVRTRPALPALKGLRTRAEVTLLVDGTPDLQETGELLFTDYGISGVCVFQLSGTAATALRSGHTVQVRINLLPELTPNMVPDWLDSRLRDRGDGSLGTCFTGVFQRILTETILKAAGLRPDQPANVSGEEKSRLCSALTAFPLTVTGTLGFEHAQVTRGGLSLASVNPRTLEVLPGLYVAGELLDVDGPCGGYNLHFAFACGLAAADAMASASQNGDPT